jgi:dTDP-4-amino-4,6-dideoxygalactose transaminase
MPEIPHNRLTFGEAECEAVLRTVRSGQWAQGPRVRELETALTRLSGVRHAVCVASGLAALRLTLGGMGVRASDSVLVPAYSCVALANSVLAWGATPVPVEVDPTHWNIEPERCRAQIEISRPRAVIAVNTFGAPVPVEEIIGGELPVIEDCAHGFRTGKLESKNGEPWLGVSAQVGILSFYATKLLGGGEGGAVLTNSDPIAEYVRSAREYADQPPAGHRMNDKMNDLEASLVLAQLERLPEMIAARETVANRYLEQLADGRFSRVFRLPPRNKQRVWYRFAVEMLAASAVTVISGLKRYGVEAAAPVTDWRPAGGSAAPNADRAYRTLVSLPLYPTLTEHEQDAVVEAFLKVCEDCAGA